MALYCSLQAQYVQDYLKAADAYFTKGDYASAAEYYEKYMGDEKKSGEQEYNPYTPQNGSKKVQAAAAAKEQATYQLAECYRLLNYPTKAEKQYKTVMTANSAGYPLARYYYAIQLRALARYEEAAKELSTFLAGYKTTDQYSKDARRELDNLHFIQAQLNRKDMRLFSVSKAGGKLNTTGASYAPVWLNEKNLLFTSTRPLDTTVKTTVYTNRVYETTMEGTVPGEIILSALPQEKGMQQGVAAVTPDGNTLYLTRWGISGDKKSAAVYSSTRTKDGWSEPVKLNESVNAPGSNNQQPFVTPDGKYLLFASNRTGGMGGFDLWMAPLENGIPGAARNLGNAINTEYDEQAPFYHAASASLIFSSNGRTGMGGFDFFQSKGSVTTGWAVPQNMGYPVNSIKDDIYFVSRGPARNILEDVILSSDRDAVCCLELFALKKTRPARALSGKVVSCDPAKPLGAAVVTVKDPSTNKTLFTGTTGADGTYSFTLDEHQPVKVEATAMGFLPGSTSMGMPADPEEVDMKYPDLCLQPEAPKVDEVFVLNNVYYEFNKSALNESSYPALDQLVNLLNEHPAMRIEIGAHTDSKGADAYNMKLSEARAQSVVKYLVEKGIAPDRLEAKGYGETMPVEPNEIEGKDNPAGREKNRRTEFKILAVE